VSSGDTKSLSLAYATSVSADPQGTTNAPVQASGSPFPESTASGRNHRGQFMAGHPGPRLTTGEHSRLVRAGVVTGDIAVLAAARTELREELGNVGVIKGSLADAYVELDAVRNYLGGRLAREGPLTTKGRQRALLTAYLGVVDRQVRLAQVLGVERRVKDVTFDAAIAREPEAR
jgi:hypothetical protein